MWVQSTIYIAREYDRCRGVDDDRHTEVVVMKSEIHQWKHKRGFNLQIIQHGNVTDAEVLPSHGGCGNVEV